MFKRAQFKELFSRILEPRDKIQVISGPRQAGKSTLVKQVLQETTVPHLLVSADNVEKTNNAWIAEMWATARARMKATKMDEYLLVGLFRDRFHPKQSFIVGSAGVPIDEFLRWDIGNLLVGQEYDGGMF